MVMEKLQLQVITNETDYSNITIGDSKFTDDIWNLSPFITAKTTKDSRKKIDFSYIENEDMKLTSKLYAYHKLGQIKPQSVRGYINGVLPKFITYCNLNNINSFSEVTKKIFLNFAIWIKEDIKINSGYTVCRVVENIIKIGQIKGWNVSKNNLFSHVSLFDLWQPQKSLKQNKTKPIPEEIFDKILYFAVNKETDILTKSGIIIQSQTGLRITEVLGIQKGCVHTTSDGYDYIEVLVPKTEKDPNPTPHKVFINELVKDIIKELEDYTKKLRQESGLTELFLMRYNGIRVLKGTNWTENRCKWQVLSVKFRKIVSLNNSQLIIPNHSFIHY